MASLLRRRPVATLCSIFCRQQHRRFLCSGPPSPKVTTVTFDVGGRTVSVETGKLALHANGAAVISIGGTRVLATVDCARSNQALDFLPLAVDYEEPTPWEKDQEQEKRKIICSHIIERVIRPFFPAGFYHGIQVTATVLSSDGIYDEDVMAAYAANAASAALMLSDIPWNGPTAVIVAARIGGEFVFNPTMDEVRCSDFNFVYACTKDNIVMIDGYGGEDVETGFTLAHSEALKYIGPQIRLAEKARGKNGVYKLSTVIETDSTYATDTHPRYEKVGDYGRRKCKELFSKKEADKRRNNYENGCKEEAAGEENSADAGA